MSRIVGAVLVLVLGLSVAAGGDESQDKPATPAEQYKSLAKEFHEAGHAFYLKATSDEDRVEPLGTHNQPLAAMPGAGREQPEGPGRAGCPGPGGLARALVGQGEVELAVVCNPRRDQRSVEPPPLPIGSVTRTRTRWGNSRRAQDVSG